MTRDGRVKILDFGLAKLAVGAACRRDDETLPPTHTEAGALMGRCGYMAPEQVRGQPVDHRSDIFAFGAILYELLCGARPFRARRRSKPPMRC